MRLNLSGTGAPQLACTPAITFDPLLSAMRTGGASVNVHTNAAGCTPGDPGCNPGVESRGQVVAN